MSFPGDVAENKIVDKIAPEQVQETLVTLADEAEKHLSTISKMGYGYLSAELRSQVCDEHLERVREQIHCQVRLKMKEIGCKPGAFIAEAKAVGTVGLELVSGDLSQMGVLGASAEVAAVMLVAGLAVNFAVQRSGDRVSQEWKATLQNGVDICGAVGMAGMAVYESGVAGTCGYDYLTGASTAHVGIHAFGMGAPMLMAATGAAAMAAMSYNTMRKFSNRSMPVAEIDGMPACLKGYFEPESRNVMVVGNDPIVKSLLLHFGITEDEVDAFLENSELEEIISDSKEGLVVSILPEVVRLARIQLQQGCFLWLFSKTLFESSMQQVVNLLSLEAADLVVIPVASEISALDLNFFTMGPQLMLKSVIVKDVKKERGFEILEMNFHKKLAKRHGINADQLWNGFYPNWLGLLGVSLECKGGIALKTLVVPPNC